MHKKILSLLVVLFLLFGNFIFVQAADDVTPPLVNGMTWSATELQPGDKLEVEIDASDLESGINIGTSTNIFIQNKITGVYKAEYLRYDETSKKLKATFNITSDMQSGEWILQFIQLKDNAGNKRFYHQSDFSKEYKVNIKTEVTDITPPVVNGMTWSATELQPGDKLEVEIDASDLESGIDIGTSTNIFIQNKITGMYKAEYLRYDEASKKLKATFNITSDMQSGEWILQFIQLKDNAGNKKFYHQSDFGKEYEFNLKSVFQGCENKKVKIGTDFNSLQGVKASSTVEGDFTDKVTYIGNVDTSKEGIYLIKYEAMGNNGDVYKNYRWISVVGNIEYDDNGEVEGSYFNKDISLNLSNLVDLNSVNITKDGNSYNLDATGSVREEGNYKIAFNSSNDDKSTEISRTFSLNNDGMSIQPLGFEFTIDKTSPKILEVYNQVTDEDTSIGPENFVKASDNNGKIKFKYITQPNWSKVGNQNIKIIVSDLAGNQVTQEVTLKINDKCDIDNDGAVSIIDLASVAKNYNVVNSKPNWNARLDFNKDGIIDIFDLVISSKRIKY